MRERPILFSAEMIRAILYSRKTQTRRALRVQPIDVIEGKGEQRGRVWYSLLQRDPNRGGVFSCRYGQPGDRLWVRETWAPVPWKAGCEYAPSPGNAGEIGYRYRATWDRAHASRWHPSIHMPRRASRISLELTAVRVERLQAISALDALAEGIGDEHFARTSGTMETSAGTETRDDWITESPEDAYRRLWNSINAKRAGGAYRWDANPWVWVLEFRRVDAAAAPQERVS